MDLVEAQKFEKGSSSRSSYYLLREQIVAVGVLGSGKKDDAMWHVPQQ